MDIAADQQKILHSQMQELEQVYFNLARNGLLWENEIALFLKNISKTVSNAINVERSGIYFLNQESKSLRQVCQYTASTNQHSQGLNLKKRNYPKYFSYLDNARLIAASDAHNDQRTQEFSRSYLGPLEISAKLDCTLIKTGKVIGVLTAEHGPSQRVWTEAEKHFLILISDLISQKLLYEELKSKSTYYSELSSFDEALLNSSNYCMISLDDVGNIRTINEATCKLSGYSSEELVGANFCAVMLHTLTEEQLADENTLELPALLNFDMLKQRIADGNEKHSECFFRHRDGHSIPANISLSEFKNTDGSVSGYLCIAADITQQVSTRKALHEEEQRYRFVFDGSADAIFLMQGDKFIDCNQSSLNMFDCTRDQLINSTPQRFSPEFQRDGKLSSERALTKINAAIDGVPQNFEWLHCQYNGKTFDAEVTLNKVQLNNQAYLLASVRDISSRKETELELNKYRNTILQQNKTLALLNDLSNQLQTSDSIDEIYNKSLNALCGINQNPRITIFDVDVPNKELHLRKHHGFDLNVIERFKTLPLNDKLHNDSLEYGKPLYLPDLAIDQIINSRLVDKVRAAGINSILMIPLIVKNQRVAQIILAYTQSNSLSADDLEIMHSIGKSVSLALTNAKNIADLEHLAHYDSLTGLSNRTYFHKNFKREILKGGYETAALYLLDLDRFKEINDTLGHFTGDKVLQLIGPRLSQLSENHNFLVSRLGGDEFIVVVYGIAEKDAAEWARVILETIQEPFHIDEMTLEIETSVGVAIYPKDGMDSHSLLRSADVAMYQAKRLGTGFSLYSEDKDIHTPERLAMIAEMGSSISTGQLFLHYQPKLDLKTNKVTGFEALARWDHPRLGLLGPSMFIPLIEMSNSIAVLTEEVLHQALLQQQSWRKAGHDYTIAVNISARNLIDDYIVKMIIDMLDYYETPAHMLELEITESALMHDAYQAIGYLKQISDLGVKLSIDDFGTGYSSLAYLQNLPVHKVKLDRKFIMGMLDNTQGTTIVKTIISLAKALDLEVIAEGVEDNDTLDQLRQMGCHKAQGYYICHPNTWENIEHWLKRELPVS